MNVHHERDYDNMVAYMSHIREHCMKTTVSTSHTSEHRLKTTEYTSHQWAPSKEQNIHFTHQWASPKDCRMYTSEHCLNTTECTLHTPVSTIYNDHGMYTSHTSEHSLTLTVCTLHTSHFSEHRLKMTDVHFTHQWAQLKMTECTLYTPVSI